MQLRRVIILILATLFANPSYACSIYVGSSNYVISPRSNYNEMLICRINKFSNLNKFDLCSKKSTISNGIIIGKTSDQDRLIYVRLSYISNNFSERREECFKIIDYSSFVRTESFAILFASIIALASAFIVYFVQRKDTGQFYYRNWAEKYKDILRLNIVNEHSDFEFPEIFPSPSIIKIINLKNKLSIFTIAQMDEFKVKKIENLNRENIRKISEDLIAFIDKQ